MNALALCLAPGRSLQVTSWGRKEGESGPENLQAWAFVLAKKVQEWTLRLLNWRESGPVLHIHVCIRYTGRAYFT
eukprot:scaffold11833_cov21-Tisochrysis_lutea.AAC.6